MVALAERKRLKRVGKEVETFKRREFKKAAIPSNYKVDKEDLQRSIYKADYYEFLKAFWALRSSETPVWNWHIRYICRKVQKLCERIFRGERKSFDLCVNVPPGTTKSTILSIMLPAWCWTRMPQFKFIGASYGGDIAQDLSMRTRDVVRSELYRKLFPEIEWRRDQDVKNYYQNTKGGWRFSVGVKGDVTGRHAHLIVIDDPLNPEESYSDAEIATSNRWIRETLSNRKVDKAISCMILVMQRLHQDDPTSQFVTRKKVFWICLPAEVTEDVKPRILLKFYKDGLLDPKRMPWPVLDAEAAEGDYYYASQFLQSPVPRGGGMFQVDNLKVRTSVPKRWKLLARGWDKAGSESGRAAFTCGVKVGVDHDGVVWILDVVRFRKNSYEREMVIKRIAQRDGRDCRIVLEQEPGSGGKESAEASVRNLRGYVAKVVKVGKQTGDKEARAEPLSSQVNGGNVCMPKASWNKPLKEEMRFFPVSKFKDQVDAASLAFNEIAKPKPVAGALRKSIPRDEVTLPEENQARRKKHTRLRDLQQALGNKARARVLSMR